jgi:hypothetical protein
VDRAGSAFLALRDGPDFPTTPGAFQTTATDGHSFVLKLASIAYPMTLSSSANPSALGTSVTVRAAVWGAPDGGAVSFYDGGSLVGAAALIGGTAVFTSTFPQGIRRLMAVYRDGSNESDSAVLYQVVESRTTCP